MDLDTLYEVLVGRNDVKWVILYKDGEVIKTNVDNEHANEIMNLMSFITRTAENAINRVFSTPKQVSFLTIYLQSGLALFFAKHGSYSIIVTIKASKAHQFEEMEQVIANVKKLLEAT